MIDIHVGTAREIHCTHRNCDWSKQQWLVQSITVKKHYPLAFIWNPSLSEKPEIQLPWPKNCFA